MYLILWMYNDLDGKEEHWLIRDALNAVGYVWCSVGIVSVIRRGDGGGEGLSRTGWVWCGIICAVIASTIHVQDLRDQEGDKSVGRKTRPLAFGDTAARWSIVGAMMGWLCVCCGFWFVRWQVWVTEALLSGVVVSRLLWMREPIADATTYKLWGLWLSSLYVLPLCHDSSVLEQLWGIY